MRPKTQLATAILATICWLLPITSNAYSYSQDITSCDDPRTQFPTNPPCVQGEPALFVF